MQSMYPLFGRFLKHWALHTVIHTVLWMALVVRITLTIRIVEWHMPQTLCSPALMHEAMFQPVKIYILPLCRSTEFFDIAQTDPTGFALMLFSAACWAVATVLVHAVLERLQAKVV